jgi:hypothetical protein
LSERNRTVGERPVGDVARPFEELERVVDGSGGTAKASGSRRTEEGEG